MHWCIASNPCFRKPWRTGLRASDHQLWFDKRALPLSAGRKMPYRALRSSVRVLALVGERNRLARRPIGARESNIGIGGSSPIRAFLQSTTPLIRSTLSSCAPLRAVELPPESRNIWRIVFRFPIPKRAPERASNFLSDKNWVSRVWL